MRNPPIYFDIETTGLRAESDRIVEIAAFCPSAGAEFAQLVHPGCEIPSDASRIHGITDQMVAKAPTFEKIAGDFCRFCEDSAGEGAILIGHNCDQFDKLFLAAEFQRVNLPLPKWRYLDSLKWARKYRPDLPRHSLQYLRQIYKIAENQAHRALDDVLVLHKVFEQMIDDLAIDQVIAMLGEPATNSALVMPFGKHQGIPLERVPKSYLKWLQTSGAFERSENEPLRARCVELGLMV